MKDKPVGIAARYYTVDRYSTTHRSAPLYVAWPADIDRGTDEVSAAHREILKLLLSLVGSPATAGIIWCTGERVEIRSPISTDHVGFE